MSSLPYPGELLAAASRPAVRELAGARPVAASRLKRVGDVVGSLLLMVVLSPVLLAIAAAVRLGSAGPVLFRQERIGYRGQRFVCLKFRSMEADADEEPHRRYVRRLLAGEDGEPEANGVYKVADDGRVTRVGQWLRRTSLDELPQLWNVLRGEMSLVGPRPALPYEVEVYDERQKARLECKPGLTGLWQVSGRSLLSYRNMCELDLEYIAKWSHGLDARILLRTLPVVLLNLGGAQ